MFKKLKSLLSPSPHSSSDEVRPALQDGDGVHVTLEELLAQRRFVQMLTFDGTGLTKAEGIGQHRSPFRGRGMEFDEVRMYQPGDDIRLIDWRVTAKTGKTHTKLYREERDRPVLFLGDFRPYMRFGTRVAFKSVIAARILSALAWASRENGDKVGGILFSSDDYFIAAPHRQMRRLMQLFRSIVFCANDTAKAEGASLASSLAELSRVSKNGGRVYVISDFHDFDDDAKKHLTYISKHCDIVCIQIFDPLEEVPPPPGSYQISDGEKSMIIHTDDPVFREEYEKLFYEQKQNVELFCKSRRLIYIKVRTNDDIMHTIRQSILSARK